MLKNYSKPECSTLTVEVATILASSPVEWEDNIKDPIWDTDGDYGLE